MQRGRECDRQMLPDLDIELALWRGRYYKANAHFEHNGVPVDAERFGAIERESPKLKLSIANKIEVAVSGAH